MKASVCKFYCCRGGGCGIGSRDRRMRRFQEDKYDQIDEHGHLYGAIIASVRDYIRDKKKRKYGEYHMAFHVH